MFNDYGRSHGLLKDKDENLSGADVREGLICVISVKLQEAEFEGQTKAKLGNTEIRTLVSNMVYSKLMEFFEENPGVAKAIFEKATQAAREMCIRDRYNIDAGGFLWYTNLVSAALLKTSMEWMYYGFFQGRFRGCPELLLSLIHILLGRKNSRAPDSIHKTVRNAQAIPR